LYWLIWNREKVSILCTQVVLIILTQIINNFTMEKKYSIPSTIITCFCVSFGIAKSGAALNENYIEIIKENMASLVANIFYLGLASLWITYVIIFVNN
jgi:hypothetical protein